jgi:CRISPR-associated endonuclease/helicase Cas3
LPTPILYHARFLPAHRAAKEAEVKRVAGKGSRAADRAGRIVVATQVAEQSLDLDFDELASDLAPVDVLLQRFGRRRRHARGADGTRAADGVERRPDDGEVVVLAPALDAPGPRWYADDLRRAGAVYPDDARLWLSLRLLTNPDLIADRTTSGALIPAFDLKPLIEAVYAASTAIEAATPAALHDRHRQAEGGDIQKSDQGRQNRLSFTQGLLDDWAAAAALPEGDAERLPTRLGDNVRILLLERRGGILAFLGDGEGDAILDRSECRCPDRLRPAPLAESDVAEIRISLSRGARQRLVFSPAIVLELAADGVWRGSAMTKDRKAQPVCYDIHSGLKLG